MFRCNDDDENSLNIDRESTASSERSGLDGDQNMERAEDETKIFSEQDESLFSSQEICISKSAAQHSAEHLGLDKISEQTLLKTSAAAMKKYTDLGLSDLNRYHIWDCGGQKVFYPLHHLFMTRYGIYLIVFDMCLILDEKRSQTCLQFIRFWLNSVWAHGRHIENGATKLCKVVLLGTHKDIISTWDEHRSINEKLTAAFCKHPIWKYLTSIDVDHILGPNAQKSNETSFKYFPVDNFNGQDDKVLQHLKNRLEAFASDESQDGQYINISIPIQWFKVLDRFQAHARTRISLSFKNDVLSLCGECGMPSAFFSEAVKGIPSHKHVEIEARTMLRFLHQLGRIMYFEEESLRDLVVLKPALFISPVTKILCRHDTLHKCKDTQITCRSDWDQLVNKGILTRDLMHKLWEDRKEYWDQLEYLMVKFGLMVPLRTQNLGEECYVVPAIYAHDEEITMFSECADSKTNSQENIHTCILLFAEADILKKWTEKGYVSASESRNKSFLPDGVFPRILCKAVEWSQYSNHCNDQLQGIDVDDLPSEFDLSTREAKIFFGDHLFVLREFPDLGIIQVQIYVASTFLITTSLYEMAKDVLAQCIPTVDCCIAVPVDGGNNIYAPGYNGLFVILTGEQGLMSRITGKDEKCENRSCSSGVSAVSLTIDIANDSELPLNVQDKAAVAEALCLGTEAEFEIISLIPLKIKLGDLKKRFALWLPPTGLAEVRPNNFCLTDPGVAPPSLKIDCLYDVFFSYRQGNFDSALTKACFCQLSSLSKTPVACRLIKGQTLSIFLDEFRLEKGLHFQDQFATALLKSEVVVPVISANALKRFLVLGENSEIDNVLLEWTLTVELIEQGLKKYCLPIFFGKVMDHPDENGRLVTDIFKETCTKNCDVEGKTLYLLDCIPEVVCEKVVGKVKSLFKKWKKECTVFPDPSDELEHRTVKDTVWYLIRHLTALKAWEHHADHDKVIKEIEECETSQLKRINHIKEQYLRNLYSFCSKEIFQKVEEVAFEKQQREDQEKRKKAVMGEVGENEAENVKIANSEIVKIRSEEDKDRTGVIDQDRTGVLRNDVSDAVKKELQVDTKAVDAAKSHSYEELMTQANPALVKSGCCIIF